MAVRGGPAYVAAAAAAAPVAAHVLPHVLNTHPTAQAVGDDLIDSIVGENIPILTGEEKYNETVTSSVSRVVAKLTGKEDPGAPFR